MARWCRRAVERSGALAEHFLQKHPDLTHFVRSPTTALVRVAVTRYIHVGHFQEVSQWTVQT